MGLRVNGCPPSYIHLKERMSVNEYFSILNNDVWKMTLQLLRDHVDKDEVLSDFKKSMGDDDFDINAFFTTASAAFSNEDADMKFIISYSKAIINVFEILNAYRVNVTPLVMEFEQISENNLFARNIDTYLKKMKEKNDDLSFDLNQELNMIMSFVETLGDMVDDFTKLKTRFVSEHAPLVIPTETLNEIHEKWLGVYNVSSYIGLNKRYLSNKYRRSIPVHPLRLASLVSLLGKRLFLFLCLRLFLS